MTRKLSTKQQISVIDKYFESKKLQLSNLLEEATKRTSKILITELRGAEKDRDFYKEELSKLKDKLVGLLSKEQIEAAKIMHSTPEDYFIEWIKICKHEQETNRWKLPVVEPPKGF